MLNRSRRIGNERRQALSDPAFEIPLDHGFHVVSCERFTAEPDALESIDLYVAQAWSNDFQFVAFILRKLYGHDRRNAPVTEGDSNRLQRVESAGCDNRPSIWRVYRASQS